MADVPVSYQFGDFLLDAPDRQLWRGDDRVPLNARYFDSLALLVREHGQLVEKDRFFAEVWDDVVVSDSALTQCIKEIRRHLGDDASNPRYIQTVPRYGYRFIEPVSVVPHTAPPVALAPLGSGEENARAIAPEPGDAVTPALAPARAWRDAARWGVAGTLGGGLAGIFGGLLYGSALGYSPAAAGLGTASILMVMLSINVLVGLVGGLGVSFGMAATSLARRRAPRWSVLGAAMGGLLVGGLAKLLGVDAFSLFFGRAPVGITGGLEGAALGATLALGARLGELRRAGSAGSAARWRTVAGGGLGGALAGALIPLAGGHLMGGSLALLAQSFAESRLHLDALGHIFGEVHFGFATQVILGGTEGLLFGSCVAGMIVLARR